MAKKKFSSSLVRRILSICFVLIVAPLIVYSAIIWDRDLRIKLNTIFSELRLMGDSSLEIYSQWLVLQQERLENFGSNLSDESLSMMFIIGENFVTVFSSHKEMEGTENFFQSELQEAFQKKGVVFAALNPYTKRQEIFVLQRFDREIRGLSVSAESWAKHFIQNNQFDLSLFDQKGKMIFSTVSDHSQKVILTPEQIENWQQHIGFLKTHSLRGSRLVINLKLPQALFDLHIGISSKQIALIEGGKLFHRLVELVIIIIILGGIGTWWLVRRMAQPFGQFKTVMNAVESQDYALRYQEDRFGFEINDLGLKFNEMLERLLTNMEEAKNERLKSELLSKELQIGRSVQRELFPKEIPQFPGLKLGFKAIPAKEVGGDFYDLFVKDKDQLMFAIADASDKGISACLYSLMVRSILRSYCQSDQQLSHAVLQTNNLFYRDANATSNFVTAWVGFYHVSDQSLTYTSAGHLPAILIHSDGQIEELTTAGIALGVSLVQEIEVHNLRLPSSSLLFLYTDGVIETHNEKGELFGKSRLLDFLRTHRALEPQQLIDRLVAEVSHFANQIAQHDDLTVLCLKTS